MMSSEYYCVLGSLLFAIIGKDIRIHVCDTWTLASAAQMRIQALEMRCYCKLLGIASTMSHTRKFARPPERT